MATKTPKPNGKNPEAKTTADATANRLYDKAVNDGKGILTDIDHGWWELGELVAKILEPHYGERTVVKYAKDIGMVGCTLQRHLNVYSAWKGHIEAPGLISYAVLRELQSLTADHPEIVGAVKKNPTMTKTEAHKIVLQYKKKKDEDKSDDWRKKENAKCFKKLERLVGDINEFEDLQALVEFAEPKLHSVFQKAGEALLAFAEQLKPDEDDVAAPPEDDGVKPDEGGVATPSAELPPRRTPDPTALYAVT